MPRVIVRDYAKLAAKHNIRMLCENCIHSEKKIVDQGDTGIVHKSRCNVDFVMRSSFGSCLIGKWEPVKYIKDKIDKLEGLR